MKLGFIGTGNMATAMMGGILANGLAKADEVIGADPTEAGRKRVQEKYGIHVTADNKTAAREAKILILSVKPQFYADVIEEIKDEITDSHLIITIDPEKHLSG